MEWATGKWKVLSWSTDLLSLSLLYLLDFFQTWASKSVTSAFPALAPAHLLAGLALLSSRCLARFSWASALCFFPSSNLYQERW